jgi:hypothetical protein
MYESMPSFFTINWVRQKTSLLNLKEKKRYDRKKYFDPSVVDVLAEHIETIKGVNE